MEMGRETYARLEKEGRPLPSSIPAFPVMYRLAKKELSGRTLDWFRAGQVINGLQQGEETAQDALRLYDDFLAAAPDPDLALPVK